MPDYTGLGELEVDFSQVLKVVATLNNVALLNDSIVDSITKIKEFDNADTLRSMLQDIEIGVRFLDIEAPTDLLLSNIVLITLAQQFFQAFGDMYGVDANNAALMLAYAYQPEMINSENTVSLWLNRLAIAAALLSFGTGIGGMLFAALISAGTVIYDVNAGEMEPLDGFINLLILAGSYGLGLPKVQAWIEATKGPKLLEMLNFLTDWRKGVPLISVALGHHFDGSIESAFNMLMEKKNLTDDEQAVLDHLKLIIADMKASGVPESEIFEFLQEAYSQSENLAIASTPLLPENGITIPAGSSYTSWLNARYRDYLNYLTTSSTSDVTYGEYTLSLIMDRGLPVPDELLSQLGVPFEDDGIYDDLGANIIYHNPQIQEQLIAIIDNGGVSP